MSFVLRLDVPDEKSSNSTNAVDKPVRKTLN
jgi:hypothetical protein